MLPFFFFNAYSAVGYLKQKKFSVFGSRKFCMNVAAFREFKRIFKKVYENLLNACRVAFYKVWKRIVNVRFNFKVFPESLKTYKAHRFFNKCFYVERNRFY